MARMVRLDAKENLDNDESQENEINENEIIENNSDSLEQFYFFKVSSIISTYFFNHFQIAHPPYISNMGYFYFIN